MALTIPAPAQQAQPIKAAEPRIVHLPVVVRDNKGALVQNATSTDFTLQVDGKPAAIQTFDLDKGLPLSLGVLVDTGESQHSAIDDERTASTAFLEQMLTGPQDEAFVVQFSRSVELLQEATASLPKLQAAFKDLGTPNANDPSGSSDTSDTDATTARRNRSAKLIQDAVFLASDEIMSKQKGRKALVLLTDGGDRNSKERLADAVEAAQRSGTVLYAIYVKGEPPRRSSTPGNPNGRNPGGGGGGYPGGGYPGGGYPGGGYPGGGYPGGGRPTGGNPGEQPVDHSDDKKTLERMALETGGRMFEAGKRQSIAEIYAEIGKELRGQYRLGFTPDKDALADGSHRVDLAFTSSDRKKFTIQTTEVYYEGK